MLKIIFLQRPGARLWPPEPVVCLPQSVALVLLLGRVREAGEGPSLPPLTGLALAVTVVISEEVLSVHASDLLSGHDVPQHLDIILKYCQHPSAKYTLTQARSRPLAMNLQ